MYEVILETVINQRDSDQSFVFAIFEERKKKAKIKSDIINVKVQKVYFNIFLFPSQWSLTQILHKNKYVLNIS